MKRAEIDNKPFWVGIGASAGGLEAMRELVKNLVDNIGAIYVIVQHMSPQHKSLLTELIARETSLDVVEITDGVAPKPDTIYVVPPNNDVVIRGQRLLLQPPGGGVASPKPSVDRFFRSMAEAVADRAIGVVLSGTGSDGAYGIQAVRAAGGITIAQTEKSAKYTGMPLASIGTGCVDLVLSPEQIGSQFARIIQLPRDLNDIEDGGEPNDALAQLFLMLLRETRVDFREYKSSTVRRRIERRMTALDMADLEAYVAHAHEHREEVAALFRDLMISVTSFFRDAEEFEDLSNHISGQLSQVPDDGYRIWIPGCATGEEVYSVAILMVEQMGGLEKFDETKLRIFATDIDANALAVGRRGFYLDAAASGIPEEYLEKYFVPTSGGYQVVKALRDRVVFTQHNLCSDPPFSNIDLVSCRNLLIYFNNVLQSKVIQRLHYALKTDGILFIGKSEPIVASSEIFQPVAQGVRIFKRRPRSELGGKRVDELVSKINTRTHAPQTPRDSEASETAGLMFDTLVSMLGPDGMLVSSDHHIRKIYGNIDRYVSLSEGLVRGATIAFLRPEIRHQVRILTTLALRSAETKYGPDQDVPNAPELQLKIEVHPISNVRGAEDLVLVLFKEREIEQSALIEVSDPDERAKLQVQELERELHTSRETLQQTVEELETANEELQVLNEELQSANEELQSNNEELETVNEELQSTNEELETVNEEMQSTNEELITVNEELQINSHEMTFLNQELDSILSNIAAPIVVVDSGLHVVRCSQSARELFQIDPFIGRPHLSQCSLPGGFPSITAIMSEIIRDGDRIEREIEAPTFKVSIVAAPYFNSKGELIGATAIISDTSELRVRHDLEMLLNNVPLMIWHKDNDNMILNLNDAAAEFMGTTRSSALGENLVSFMPDIADQELQEDLATIMEDEPKVGVVEQIKRGDEDPVWISKSKVPYSLADGQSGVYVVAQDITEDHNERMELGRRKALMDRILDALPVGVEFIDPDGVLSIQNAASRDLSGPMQIGEAWHPGDASLKFTEDGTGTQIAPDQHPTHKVLQGEECPGFHVSGKAASGASLLARGFSRPVRGGDGEVLGAVNVLVELSGDVDVAAE